jgi:hypothetical protein
MEAVDVSLRDSPKRVLDAPLVQLLPLPVEQPISEKPGDVDNAGENAPKLKDGVRKLKVLLVEGTAVEKEC